MLALLKRVAIAHGEGRPCLEPDSFGLSGRRGCLSIVDGIEKSVGLAGGTRAILDGICAEDRIALRDDGTEPLERRAEGGDVGAYVGERAIAVDKREFGLAQVENGGLAQVIRLLHKGGDAVEIRPHVGIIFQPGMGVDQINDELLGGQCLISLHAQKDQARSLGVGAGSRRPGRIQAGPGKFLRNADVPLFVGRAGSPKVFEFDFRAFKGVFGAGRLKRGADGGLAGQDGVVSIHDRGYDGTERRFGRHRERRQQKATYYMVFPHFDLFIKR